MPCIIDAFYRLPFYACLFASVQSNQLKASRGQDREGRELQPIITLKTLTWSLPAYSSSNTRWLEVEHSEARVASKFLKEGIASTTAPINYYLRICITRVALLLSIYQPCLPRSRITSQRLWVLLHYQVQSWWLSILILTPIYLMLLRFLSYTENQGRHWQFLYYECFLVQLM